MSARTDIRVLIEMPVRRVVHVNSVTPREAMDEVRNEYAGCRPIKAEYVSSEEEDEEARDQEFLEENR